MKKGLTELIFILDKSGSMSGLESDTIGGFNSMLCKQKDVQGSALVTTVLFNDDYELLHDRVDINKISEMTKKDFVVGGCTALLDAVGTIINKIKVEKNNTPIDEQAEKIIFVIITDGRENSSLEFSYAKLKSMIETQKEQDGWEFIFLGANMNAVAEASKLGIEASRSVTYENDSEGIELNYRTITQFLSRTRTSNSKLDGSWKKEIEANRKKNSRNKSIY